MRSMFVTILGVAGLAGIVLFCGPVRKRVDEVLFSNAQAVDMRRLCDEEQPKPLKRAADGTRNALKCIWPEDTEEAGGPE